jgi:hypothetical protein
MLKSPPASKVLPNECLRVQFHPTNDGKQITTVSIDWSRMKGVKTLEEGTPVLAIDGVIRKIFSGRGINYATRRLGPLYYIDGAIISLATQHKSEGTFLPHSLDAS